MKNNMTRHAFAMKIKKGMLNEYRSRLGKIWPELTAYLDCREISNYSIWNAEDLIFGYYEKKGTEAICIQDAQVQKLIHEMEDTFEWISRPGEDMRLMYQDFGVVRECKELIRHRMFMTKLKPDCEEEYKARHDGLIAKRNGQISQGPDSNFSIWSAGGYIFGYDEIDTTMETEETEETKQSTIEWETRQLEIMDWITNDADWLTGEHHAASKRLGWHA